MKKDPNIFTILSIIDCVKEKSTFHQKEKKTDYYYVGPIDIEDGHIQSDLIFNKNVEITYSSTKDSIQNFCFLKSTETVLTISYFKYSSSGILEIIHRMLSLNNISNSKIKIENGIFRLIIRNQPSSKQICTLFYGSPNSQAESIWLVDNIDFSEAPYFDSIIFNRDAKFNYHATINKTPRSILETQYGTLVVIALFLSIFLYRLYKEKSNVFKDINLLNSLESLKFFDHFLK
jgi:hypothetical protein